MIQDSIWAPKCLVNFSVSAVHIGTIYLPYIYTKKRNNRYHFRRKYFELNFANVGIFFIDAEILFIDSSRALYLVGFVLIDKNYEIFLTCVASVRNMRYGN